MINLDEYESVESHCIPFYVNDNNLEIIVNKNISTYFYRIQAYDSIICELFLYWIY